MVTWDKRPNGVHHRRLIVFLDVERHRNILRVTCSVLGVGGSNQGWHDEHPYLQIRRDASPILSTGRRNVRENHTRKDQSLDQVPRNDCEYCVQSRSPECVASSQSTWHAFSQHDCKYLNTLRIAGSRTGKLPMIAVQVLNSWLNCEQSNRKE